MVSAHRTYLREVRGRKFYTFRLVDASGNVLALVEADDEVMNLVEDMDEGRLPDIPVATTDDGGDVLTRCALEWRGRLLSDGQKFSDLELPHCAELKAGKYTGC